MKTTRQIKEELLHFTCPRWSDLPDFELYMDQLIACITKYLEPLYFQEEKILTNSMVNNYVKHSILEPPIKKHYNAKHMAYLIVVCILKRVFTLTEIAQLIEVQSRMQNSNYVEAYDKFSSYLEIYLHEVMEKGNLNELCPRYRSKEEEVLCNVVSSIALKIYTEYYLLSTKK